MIKTLSESESFDILLRGRLARLGCIVEGEPYVVPVNYYLDGDNAYLHSLPGRKIEALRRHPRACLQVDEIRDEANWRSVLAYGHYEEIGSHDERAHILNDFYKRFALLTPVESVIVHDGASLDVIVFRLRIDTVSGIGEG